MLTSLIDISQRSTKRPINWRKATGKGIIFHSNVPEAIGEQALKATDQSNRCSNGVI